MDYIPEHFKLTFKASADPQAEVRAGNARFTVLTPRMIRMEWSPSSAFEDRPSQAFWFRHQPVPAFEARRDGDELVIETAFLRLHYRPEQPFSAESLWIELTQPFAAGSSDSRFANATTTSPSGGYVASQGGADGAVWRYGDPDPHNLLGTARTVDEVDGATPLSLGLVSRSGWSLVDDSNSLVFNEVGWLESRDPQPGQVDLYFLGYGHDYLGCLHEFNLVSGSVPMLPRFVLGNWWSRYWEYTQDELTQLMADFQAHQVPLSVCIIDMDWHIVKDGNTTSSGWTGYSWNRKLFPDPEGTLRFLHDKGLKVALNLHPADGIHPHEDMYAEMAEAVGQDPAEKQPVEFDIANPRFTEAYFRVLHHPQEKMGIDFWWMDWQQGVKTRLSGLDPLWWLNHLHFLDLGRDGKRRSFVFSRWGGLGNHRYPIGFSGDSVVSWASLAFQPYFTATASNVNYGWWSHDIGGHMGGHEDAELYTRWVQLGAFLPVLRLHSTKNPFHERRPWGFDHNTFMAARQAMQLRHALIPYLYSMAWRYHRENIPPILPMYYDQPEQEAAYACPNQYWFGNQMVVAPFITPADPHTRLSRAVAWLPAGDWYDFFTGQYSPGDGWQARYGTLEEIPVFAKAGAIIPQGPMAGWGNVEAPEELIINVFPGADGRFDLYEDQGNSMDYLESSYAITPLRQAWDTAATTLTIGPAEGVQDLLPNPRQVALRFRGFNRPESVEVRLNDTAQAIEPVYDPATRTLTVSGLRLAPTDRLEVTLSGQNLANQDDARLETCQKLMQHFRMESWARAELARQLPEMVADPAGLGRYMAALSPSQARALFEVLTGAGLDETNSTGSRLIVTWNNQQNPGVTEQFAVSRQTHWWRYKERYPWANGPAPRFLAYRPEEDFGEKNPWMIQLSYFGLSNVKVEGK